MSLSKFLNVPEWFSLRSPEQEDTIDHAVSGYEKAEEVRRKGMEDARAAALPYMSEIVRDMDSRSEASVRGGIRLWTSEAYDRVMSRRSVWRKMKKWFFNSFSNRGYAKYP